MVEHDNVEKYKPLVDAIKTRFPATQAIYLYGTFGTPGEREDSDVDIALLLPPRQAKEVGLLAVDDLRMTLEELLDKEVDLVNLRLVPTVLQKEVIMAERRILCVDRYASDEFEMLTLSYYQKLNEERAEIIKDIIASGRIVE